MKLLILAYLLNIIDYIFTSHWVNLYGIDIEGNPLGRWLYENNAAFGFKFFIVGAFFTALGYFINRYPKYAYTAFIPLVVYGVIDLYHIYIYFAIRW